MVIPQLLGSSPLCKAAPFHLNYSSEFRVTLRLAVYSQSVRLGDKPLEIQDQNFYFPTEHLRLLCLCNILSDETMGLSFTIAAGPRQRSHSQVRDPRESWPYFTVSDSRPRQPGGPGSRIYIPKEQGGPVIPPGTGLDSSSFSCLPYNPFAPTE
jgi:hypothetical protein